MSVRQIYNDSIVIDLVAPLLSAKRAETIDRIEDFRSGGVTAAGATVAVEEDFAETIDNLTQWHAWFDAYPDRFRLVRHISDIVDCKAKGLTGIILHFQNSVAFGLDLRRLLIFYELGVRVIQLTYNRRNFVGDGCTVPEDAGLSDFGRRAIREMDRLGIVVDLSHTGYRTTMEAIELSNHPVIFSHSNIAEVYPSKRNIRREQVRAVAARGGVIGLNGCEYFIRAGRQSTVDDLIAHADFIADEVGVDHISVGLDHFWGHTPHLPEAEQHRLYSDRVRSGRFDPETWPAPPWYQANGIETPQKTSALADSLAQHGYVDDDIQKILGGNLMRVFEAVWKN